MSKAKREYVVNGKFVERKKAKKKAARRAKADVPRVVKASDGKWDIRTKTYYWSPGFGMWVERSVFLDRFGQSTKSRCMRQLPAARAAWRKLQAGKKGGEK